MRRGAEVSPLSVGRLFAGRGFIAVRACSSVSQRGFGVRGRSFVGHRDVLLGMLEDTLAPGGKLSSAIPLIGNELAEDSLHELFGLIDNLVQRTGDRRIFLVLLAPILKTFDNLRFPV